MATSLQEKMDGFLNDLKDQYTKAVRNNPETVAQIESLVRILSFLVAGRFENGEIISELIYSSSNLLIFLNDNIFKAASKLILKSDFAKERIKRWLTVLEYTEVFLEMASRKKWGEYGAWVIITVVQLAKTAMRYVILMKLDGGLQTTPSVAPVDREVLKAAQLEHDNLEDAWDELAENTQQEKTFTLKSSGRQIRTLEAAPANGLRTWSVPQSGDSNVEATVTSKKRRLLNQPATRLTNLRLWAERLHIARPLAHLLGMYMCGLDSWKPWLLACGMDISSNMLMGEPKDLNVKEQAELKRRNLLLLYYLLRSPFYNRHTKLKIIAILRFIATHVPLSGFVIRPLLDYLPTWQKMYFYVWAT